MRTSTRAAASRDLPPQGGSGAMFDRIAWRYDALNRILSLGIDRRWRRQAVAALALVPGGKVLDLATGTADVGLEVLRQQPSARVVGLDPSPGMLTVGRRKVAKAGYEQQIELRQGQAETLPFADHSFDGVTIAFGIRNVEDRPRALREMARVARPGARVAILELSEPQGGLLAPLVRFHVRKLVPRIGGWLSGVREYRYLQQSIAAFPVPDAFAAMMAENGLEVLTVKPLTFGTCCLFVGCPAEGRPAEGRPAEGRPAEGRPAEGRPAVGRPAVGRPTEGRSAEGCPAEGRPAEGRPAEEHPVEERT